MNALDGEEQAQLALRRRFPRGRFQLTAQGLTALESYRKGVSAAQNGVGGRQVLEEFQATWAESCGVSSRDALLLEEMAAGPKNVTELRSGLDDCGMGKPAIESGIDRLASVGLIDLAQPPSP